MIGTTIAHYRIIAKLGEGGMGEVYRANDLKLKRDVALKILPAAVAHNPERMARFAREAELLAALNHPNIAAIYGVEDRTLVMELVDGPTLADRIAQGAIPVPEALAIARQIVEALEAAHEKAIIHRDLKPANIKITPEGQVKVLDFGLARAVEGRSVSAEQASVSPTLTVMAGTEAGVIMGTAAYMAPEQARGIPADRRADVWAFGAVLYEMVTGKQVFDGETISDVLAAVLKNEPDWSAVPPDAPVALLRRCLTKERKQRLQAIGEARIAIEEFGSSPASEQAAPAPTRRGLLAWAVTSSAAFVGAAGWILLRSREQQSQTVMKLFTDLPDAARTPNLTMSADGSVLAYRKATRVVAIRNLNQFDTKTLAGTEGSFGIVVMSPDGRWIAFRAGDALKKVMVFGGAPVTLCDLKGFGGGLSWGENDIVAIGTGSRFAAGTGLEKVSADGGKREPLTQLDSKNGEVRHVQPFFLPGGNAVLFAVQKKELDFDIGAVDLRTGRHRTVWTGGSQPAYLPTGHLVFVRGATMFAVRFDARKLVVTGTPVPVLDDIQASPLDGSAEYAFSQTGTLLYKRGSEVSRDLSLVWIDRGSGKQTPLSVPEREYSGVRVSPDGSRIAFSVNGPTAADISVLDLRRGSLMRVAFEPGAFNTNPVWSPDGKYLAYSSVAKGKTAMLIRPADGSGHARELVESALAGTPTSFSHNGKHIVFTRQVGGRREIWVSDVERGSPSRQKPRALIESQDDTFEGQVSPDGKWLAYATTSAPVAMQVMVEPFSPSGRQGSGGKWQVSTERGSFPRWSLNGRELFHTFSGPEGVKLYSVDIEPSQSFRPGVPKLLPVAVDSSGSYDPSADGKSFLTALAKPREEKKGFHVIVNWFDEVKRLAP